MKRCEIALWKGLVCPSVCLSIRLSIWLSVGLSVDLCVHLSVCWAVPLSARLCVICPSVRPSSVYPSVRPSVRRLCVRHLSVHPSHRHRSIRPSVYLSVICLSESRITLERILISTCWFRQLVPNFSSTDEFENGRSRSLGIWATGMWPTVPDVEFIVSTVLDTWSFGGISDSDIYIVFKCHYHIASSLCCIVFETAYLNILIQKLALHQLTT